MSAKHSSPVHAVAYYRMSTDRQEDSIERQKSQVEAYAARQGYQIIREYTDEGIAGDEEGKRKGFLRMIREAQKPGDFQVILCDDTDRFSRNDVIDKCYYIKLLRDAGVRLETCAQGKANWDTFTGRVLEALLAESKAMESRATSRRVMTQMVLMARQGIWPGGPIPYAYRLEELPVWVNDWCRTTRCTSASSATSSAGSTRGSRRRRFPPSWPGVACSARRARRPGTARPSRRSSKTAATSAT
jgi:DNA invertase Pin-like site-specific DNA recombinase